MKMVNNARNATTKKLPKFFVPLTFNAVKTNTIATVIKDICSRIRVWAAGAMKLKRYASCVAKDTAANAAANTLANHLKQPDTKEIYPPYAVFMYVYSPPTLGMAALSSQ